MEKDSYKTLAGQGTAEIIEKKSRFISAASPAETEEEALGFLASIRASHPNASHNVCSWILGLNGEYPRQSDDGEPSGTAGAPTLGAIRQLGITNAVVVVTRYFGGILLGAGGLVRAYGQAAREGLAKAGVAERFSYDSFNISIAYPLLSKFQHECAKRDFILSSPVYEAAVTIDVLVRSPNAGEFKKFALDISGGAAVPIFKGKLYR